MLIIEGADLVGKTVFAQKLLKHPTLQEGGMIYSHFTRLPSGWNYLSDYFARASPNVVQDRFHMSEIVYSRARKETESPLTPERYRLVDGYLRGLGAYTIVITSHADHIKERYKREEMYNLDVVLHVNAMYKEIVNNDGTDWHGYKIDFDMVFTSFPTDDDLNDVVEAYTRRQDTCARWRKHDNSSVFKDFV